MPRETKMTEEQIQAMVKQLPDWKVTGGKLHREYKFPDFSTAFKFMATAVPAIEKMDHHPEWSNVYNRVTVDLTTHDAGGITAKDFDLAMLLEGIAKRMM